MVKVSVIIPVYNNAKYLKKCLDSVCNQTLSNIEIICVNDGSEDNSLEILKEYKKNDNRIKIINFTKNKGAGAARNSGIKEANGAYIGFIDSDDFIDLDFYEKLYQKAIATDSDIIKSNLKNILWNKKPSSRYYNLKDIEENKVKFNHVPTSIFKRDFLIKNNILFPEDLKCAEDSVFEVVVSTCCNKIEVVKDVTYYYVWQEKSLNHTQLVDLDKIKEIEKSMLRIIDIFNSLKIDKKTYLDGVENRYKYLSFFIKDKIVSEECKEYVYQTEKKLFSKLKYQQDLKKREINKRAIKAWDIEIKKSKKILYKYIISLTSFPARMENLHYCLFSILNQTIIPDEIILWLSREEFPNKEKNIPLEVLKLQDLGLKIKFTSNIKSYKKLIPTLKEYPNDVIITADDDVYYSPDWFEKLYNIYNEDKQNILCHRAHKINFDNKNNIALYKYWSKIINDNSTSYLNFFTGAGGILYPPNSLYKDILNEDIFMKLSANADDIWFWAMAVLNKRKIRVIPDPISNIKEINLEKNKETKNLWQTNIVENDIQLKNIIIKYPQILEILKDELKKNI